MYEDDSDLSSQDSRPAAAGLSSSSSDHSVIEGAGNRDSLDKSMIQVQVHWEEDEMRHAQEFQGKGS